MLLLSTAQDYFLWHYSRAFGELYRVWLNFLWFTIHFFSLPQLVRTWLSPYKRITERKHRGWDFEEFIGYVVINLLSRVVGALMRTILIGLGLISLAVVIGSGLLLFLIWIFLPFMILGLFLAGITLLFI